MGERGVWGRRYHKIMTWAAVLVKNAHKIPYIHIHAYTYRYIPYIHIHTDTYTYSPPPRQNMIKKQT